MSAEKNCLACSDLQENSAEFVVNGVTDNVCNSLKNNTGMDTRSGHNDCDDLNAANDCLIGNLEDEVDNYEVCNWKGFMPMFIHNLWNVLKAMICSMCGLWAKVESIESGETIHPGTGLTKNGLTINHSNAIEAGGAGQKTDTSGYIVEIPYVEYDAEGHITEAGTRNHTVPSGGGGGGSADPLAHEYVCMATYGTPSYEGTYNLRKKCFAPMFLEDTGVTWNPDFVESFSRRSAVMRTDDRICINLNFAVSTAMSDTTVLICSIPMATLGLSDVTTSYTVAHADGVDSIGFVNAYKSGTDFIINFVDYLPHGQGQPAGQWDLQIDLVFSESDMENSACNRFYYERTA